MEKAVITGMGIVSPVGNSLADFEHNVFEGHHGIVDIDHFDTSDMGVRVYAPVKELDAEAYVPARELRRLDAYTLFGLVAAKQAVAHAGILGNVDPFRLGVNMTSGLGGVGSALSENDTMQRSGPRKVSPMLMPKWIPNILSGLVAIDTGAQGAALAHNAACASSAVSIGEAVRAIRHGYLDAAICGGGEAITQKLVMAGFQNLRALTTSADPDRASIPFDRERSGFVMGEGGAALVVESESHARARGATILAEVSGYGITCDAFHITAPADDGAALDRAIRDALAEAGEAEAGVHVNAHGTSTMKNDEVEAAAVARVLGEGTLVTSTKATTGHLLGAAGATEAIASVLALHRGQVPPTAGTREIDDEMRVDVVRGRARDADLSRAVSLSLGFGGHNTCLVIDKVAA